MKIDLNGKKIFVSAAIPDELQKGLAGQFILTNIMIVLRCILRAGGRLVFGGHPTITPLVYRAARTVEAGPDSIEIYQLRYFEKETPPELAYATSFGRLVWMGSSRSRANLELDLAAMRKEMCLAAEASIFVGGRRGGVRDEYQGWLAHHGNSKPTYLLGFARGDALEMILEQEREGTEEPNGFNPYRRKIAHHGNEVELIAPWVVRDISQYGLRQVEE